MDKKKDQMKEETTDNLKNRRKKLMKIQGDKMRF